MLHILNSNKIQFLGLIILNGKSNVASEIIVEIYD